MKSAKRPKSKKKSSRHERISKKRYKNTRRGKFCLNEDLSGLYIDDINDAIRINKSRQRDGKGSWKLVPKDSCEVYKDRRKRSATNEESDPNSEEMSSDTESCMEEDETDNKKKCRKKYTKKSQSKKHPKKKRSKSYSKSAYSSASQSTCYSQPLECTAEGKKRHYKKDKRRVEEDSVDLNGKGVSTDMKLPDVNNNLNADKDNAEITTSWKSDEKLDPAVVFNSKRSKVPILLEKQKNYRKTLLPNSSTESLQRNGLNVNYGSLNLTAGNNMHKREKSSFSGSRPKRKTETDRNDTSDTVSVHKVVIKQKKKTMNDNSGNISKTQAFHKNIICQAAILSRDVNAKRTTMFDESRNTFISDTASIKVRNSGATLPVRRRAVYKDDTHNKSVTQVVSNNNSVKKHKTTEYDSNQDDIFNAQTIRPSNKKGSIRKPANNNKYNIIISMTQDSSSNILDKKVNKGKTIESNDETALANLMQSDKETKEQCRIIHENARRKFTVTKALHVNIILLNNETHLKGQQTVAHEDNISMMQVSESNKDNNESESIPALLNNGIEMSKPKRIFYETGTGNITIKQTTQLKVTPKYGDEKPIPDFGTSLKHRSKKKATIFYDNDVSDASTAGNKIEEARNKRNTYDDDEANIFLSLDVTENNYKLDLTADVKKSEEIKYVKPEAIGDIKLIDYDEFETNKGEESVTETIAAEPISLAYDDDINLAISTNCSLLDNVDSTANMSKPEEHIEHKQTIFDYNLYQEDILKKTEDVLQDNNKSSVFNANYLYPETSIPKLQIFPETDKSKVMCDHDKCWYCNISVAQQIPAELITVDTEFLNAMKSKPVSPQPNITVLQASTINSSSICSTADPNIDKVFDGAKIQTDVDEKKGSQSSLFDRNIDGVNKSLIAIAESDPLSVAIPQDPAAECMFYVYARTDRRWDSAKHKDEIEHGGYLQRKAAELKKVVSQNTDFPCNSLKEDKRNEHVDIEQQNYNQSIADVTRELLSLISNITGNLACGDAGKPAVIEGKNKDEAIKHKRLSPASNGQSSAQAELQKTRGNDCVDEDISDTSEDISEKSDRTSHKVDNTKFSDEWNNETAFKYEEKCPTLKKTTFDETSYMIDETKEKVIPTYLSEVSDGIKELMMDLVKPANDNIMVENELIASKNTPMQGGQIQANLDVSSHKDKTGMPKVLPVLTFDYYNPLHNILLSPPVLSDVHKYNPIKCYEVAPLTNRKQEKICVCQKNNQFTTYPSSSKSCRVKCVDQSVDAVSTHITHDEANTIIVMKRNEELLQASSSLTIIEDVTKNRALTPDNSKHSNHWFSFSSQVDVEAQRCVNSSHSRMSATFNNKHIYNHATDKNKQDSASMEMIAKIQKSPHEAKTEWFLTDDSTHTMGPGLKEAYNKNVSSSKVAEKKSSRNKLTYIYFVEQSTQPAALIFDHRIPMNNIQLSPNNITDTHKYNPRKTEESFCSSASSFHKKSKGDCEVEIALSSTQYTMKPGTDAVQEDNVSNGPTIENKSEDKDDKVNLDDSTVGMDGNKELLIANLSPTVCDETKGENISKNSKQSHLKIDSSRSPLVNIKDQEAKIETIAKILGNSSGDQFSSLNSREMLIYSPFIENHKQYPPPMEVTLKPTAKMQNVTTSHKVTTDDFTHYIIPEKNAKETNNQTAHLSKIYDKKSPGSKETPIFVEQPNPVVLVFDQNNPLNNIRIAPINITGAHKYEPRQTEDLICDNGNRLMNEKRSLMTTLYVRKPVPTTKQDDMIMYKKGHRFNVQSATGRTISAEQSLDENLTQESEGNTTITMKGNQEFIESISSHTLVADELESKNRIISTSNKNSKRGIKVARSFLGHKKKQEQAAKTDSQRKNAKLQEISSRGPFHSNWSATRDKKRILLPSTSKQRSSSVKMTKRTMVAEKKMLKSNPCHKHKQYQPPITPITNVTNPHKVTDELLSTKYCTPILAPKDVTENINQNATKISSNNKVTRTSKINTVQPLITDYHNIEIDHQDDNDSDVMTKKYESLTALTEASFTSSNNLRDDNGLQSSRQISKQDIALLDWHAEPSDYYVSGVDLIAKMNELPFMGYAPVASWEVTMHIKLVIQDYWSVPWPKAGGVHVTQLDLKQLVPNAHVQHALSYIPWDWRLVPKTIGEYMNYSTHYSTPPSCPTSELYN